MKKLRAETTRRGYEKIAKAYHAQRGKYASKSLLQKFSKQLKKGLRVLDAGCGAGVPVAKILANKGYKVTGIDFAQNMVSLARRNVPTASFLKMDMTRMKFKENSFDGAVSFYAIIHIPREKHAKIYRSLHKVLTPDGIILVNASGATSENAYGAKGWEGYEKNYLGVPMFWSFYSHAKTLKIIRNAGFQILWHNVLKRGDERQFWVLARNKKSKTP